MKVWLDKERWVVLKAVLDAKVSQVSVHFSKIETFGAKGIKDVEFTKKMEKRFFRYSPPEEFEVVDLDF
jgi:outer membrane lipoprotein-sorting protein